VTVAHEGREVENGIVPPTAATGAGMAVAAEVGSSWDFWLQTKWLPKIQTLILTCLDTLILA
jgi:hypothetical protein